MPPGRESPLPLGDGQGEGKTPAAAPQKSVLRLFDESIKCDEEGLLKGAREAIEGKE